MECSGNSRNASFGLISSADWSGLRVLDALDRFETPAGARGLLVSGFDQYSQPSQRSTPGASWIFTFDELEQTGAFLATELNGAPLPDDHGAPVRLVVPGWYGCTCIKWVNELRFVGDDEPATSQMREFASRTLQDGTPELARDYLPAEIDLAAMPVRVEKWQVSGATRYRVVGIQWGGAARTDGLEIRFGGGPWQSICMADVSQGPWALWEHDWQPAATGTYAITLRAADPSIRTRRLDAGYYLREVAIEQT
jgi:DMSO/TMAO reductase YedYZ molybdopterin-dependent catalytic subunit